MNTSIFGSQKDAEYMAEALKEAQKAFAENEVPIGAVIVDSQGAIVARAYNCVEREHSQLAHAEVRAIEDICKRVGDWRLNGYWLYVTLEPCAMCMGLIKLCRFDGVVYGASSPLFGFRLDNTDTLSVYKRDTFTMVDGVRSQDAVVLLKKFFQQKRKKE